MQAIKDIIFDYGNVIFRIDFKRTQIFAFLSFIPQILLFWFPPMVIPKSLVWLALLCNLIALASTIIIQIPIQIELDKQFSLELIDRLFSTDFIYRKIPMILMAMINFTMLYRVDSSV